MIFEQRDVVIVPYPLVEMDRVRHRPALVVSSRPLGEAGSLLWVLMITSAAHRSWPGDIRVPGHQEAGLPVPSVIRASKIATVEASGIRRIGRLAEAAWQNVVAELAASLGFAP